MLKRFLLTLFFLLLNQQYRNINTKRYDKHDDFTFPIVNLPFISSHITATPAHVVSHSKLIRYSLTELNC